MQHKSQVQNKYTATIWSQLKTCSEIMSPKTIKLLNVLVYLTGWHIQNLWCSQFKFSKASADTIASNLKGSKQNNKDKRSHKDEIYSLLKCFSEISSSNYALELIWFLDT